MEVRSRASSYISTRLSRDEWFCCVACATGGIHESPIPCSRHSTSCGICIRSTLQMSRRLNGIVPTFAWAPQHGRRQNSNTRTLPMHRCDSSDGSCPSIDKHVRCSVLRCACHSCSTEMVLFHPLPAAVRQRYDLQIRGKCSLCICNISLVCRGK